MPKMSSGALLTLCVLAAFQAANGGDINRQSIVFYEDTPDVFYCPQEKPTSFEGMIVKAKPLKALCEGEGRPLPDGYKSDCWNDVDETEYACSEKKRILLKLKPPGSENAVIDNYVPIFRKGAYKIQHIDSPDDIKRRNWREKQEKLKKAEEEEKNKSVREPKNDF